MIFAEPPRTQWDLKWSMLGVPVRVHPYFWLVSFLLAYHPGVPIPWVLLTVAALFVSILVHEFGHALSARQCGEAQSAVVLYAAGGLCLHGGAAVRHWQRIWILFWGPG